MELVALPETIRGLPLHVLVVHAVVVLVPLVAFGTIVVAAWPAVRRHFGALLVLGAIAATALAPIATGSGRNFARQLGAQELVKNHSQWGQRVLPAMLVLLVCLVALVLLDILRRTAPSAGRDPGPYGGAGQDGGEPVPAGVGGRATSAPRGQRATLAAPAPADEARLTVVDRWIGARLPRRLRSTSAELWSRRLEALFAVLCVLAALVALYVVIQTGESGAKAVWSGR